MSVKATERSMHVSLYMRGPLSRGCTMLGLCWHVLTGLRAPWSLLWGGGRQKRLSGPLFGAGPISGCTNVPFGFGYSLLVFEHLGCWGRVAMYKQVALLLRLFLLTLPFHLLRNQRPLNSGGRQAWGARLQPGTPLRSWPPMPLYSILRFVCPLDFLLCNCLM